MRDILRRSQDCPVCGLLYRFGKETGLCDSDYLRCRRSGSTVRVDPDGPTILSLFADPGKIVLARWEGETVLTIQM